MHTCTYVCTGAYMYAYICVHQHSQVHLHTLTHACVHVCITRYDMGCGSGSPHHSVAHITRSHDVLPCTPRKCLHQESSLNLAGCLAWPMTQARASLPNLADDPNSSHTLPRDTPRRPTWPTVRFEPRCLTWPVTPDRTPSAQHGRLSRLTDGPGSIPPP